MDMEIRGQVDDGHDYRLLQCVQTPVVCRPGLIIVSFRPWTRPSLRLAQASAVLRHRKRTRRNMSQLLKLLVSTSTLPFTYSLSCRFVPRRIALFTEGMTIDTNSALRIHRRRLRRTGAYCKGSGMRTVSCHLPTSHNDCLRHV